MLYDLDYDSEIGEILNMESTPIVLEAFDKELNRLNEITPEYAKEAIKAVMKSTGFKGKAIFMPIRIVLTGTMHGPDLNKIIALIGKKECCYRISSYYSWREFNQLQNHKKEQLTLSLNNRN